MTVTFSVVASQEFSFLSALVADAPEREVMEGNGLKVIGHDNSNQKPPTRSHTLSKHREKARIVGFVCLAIPGAPKPRSGNLNKTTLPQV